MFLNNFHKVEKDVHQQGIVASSKNLKLGEMHTLVQWLTCSWAGVRRGSKLFPVEHCLSNRKVSVRAARGMPGQTRRATSQ